MTLTEEIKDFALDLGYCAVGVAPADPFPQFAEKLAERGADYAALTYLPPFADPRNTFPAARSIVVAVYDYHAEGFPPELLGRIGRLYQARCYNPPPERINGSRTVLMRRFLESKGLAVGPWPNGRSGVPDRQAAARAGVTRFGRNTFACVEGIGSFVMPQSFVVDAELDYDRPNEGIHCPADCRLCRKACPTGAITEDLRLNPRRCIAYNSFFTRGADTGVSPYIPREIRGKMGGWVHGCDVCQEVCPKNAAKVKGNLPVNPFLARKAREFDLYQMLALSDEYYARVVQPLMYNYIRDRAIFRRNAAIALGNVGGTEAVPALARALADDVEFVRAHVAWALGNIGGAAARQALEAHLRRETGEIAREETALALAKLV